jgi:hypothetical protein
VGHGIHVGVEPSQSRQISTDQLDSNTGIERRPLAVGGVHGDVEALGSYEATAIRQRQMRPDAPHLRSPFGITTPQRLDLVTDSNQHRTDLSGGPVGPIGDRIGTTLGDQFVDDIDAVAHLTVAEQAVEFVDEVTSSCR